MPALVTLGDLASVYPEEKAQFKAIIASLDKNYPVGWRDWQVYNYSFHELFGSNHIPSAVDVKLRFAIPTVDVALAFDASTNSLSERSYRSIRATIIKWPLGRALVYSPHGIMEKIHGPSYNLFMDTVAALKSKLFKRSEATVELGSLRGKKRSIEMDEVEVHQPKRSAATPTPSIEHPPPPSQGSEEHLLASVLSQQASFFNTMLKLQSEQNENVKKLLQNSATPNREETPSRAEDVLNSSFESHPDSTISEEICSSKHSKETDLRARIADAQRQLVELHESDDSDTEPIFDFMPATVTQEPKIAKADPTALEHGLKCQKFRDADWRNVRYAETQKQFQATPAFSALKPNNLLAGVAPDWKSSAILERFDLVLGAITNGLLQQRIIFQNLLDSLPKEMKKKVGKDFVAADSNFRKTSDALVQYVCGRRAEVLQQRRDFYKPQDKALKNILHDIPPCETYLFEEKAFTEAVKEQGGIHKFFPAKKRHITPAKASRQQNYQNHSSRGRNNFRQNSQYRNRDSRNTKRSNYNANTAHAKANESADRAQKHFNPNPNSRGKKWGEGRK